MTKLLGKISLVLAVAALGGCVVADPGPGPYAYGSGYYAPAPAYVAPEVAIGGCWGCGGRHHWR